jgi:hypothetical protein
MGKIDFPYTHVQDRSLSRLRTETSVKKRSGGVELVLWVQTPPFIEMVVMYFPRVSNQNNTKYY